MVADGLGLVVVDHTHLLLELLLRPDVVLLSAELVGEFFLCELVNGLGLQRMRDIRDSEVDIFAGSNEALSKSLGTEGAGESTGREHRESCNPVGMSTWIAFGAVDLVVFDGALLLGPLPCFNCSTGDISAKIATTVSAAASRYCTPSPGGGAAGVLGCLWRYGGLCSEFHAKINDILSIKGYILTGSHALYCI